jgi:hypothetical protein
VAGFSFLFNVFIRIFRVIRELNPEIASPAFFIHPTLHFCQPGKAPPGAQAAFII